MLNCHDATRLISESQEHPLAVRQKMALKVHLLMCTGCKNFSLQIPFISRAMRAYAQGKDEEIKSEK